MAMDVRSRLFGSALRSQGDMMNPVAGGPNFPGAMDSPALVIGLGRRGGSVRGQ